ncbi:MAG: antirestriction protein ArdA, partial [Pseudomonadota bacterium]
RKGKTMEYQGETRIYVACLASYNNGILHGKWIDATQDEEAIWDEVKQMLTNSPTEVAEEWTIHDYEGFYGFRLTEFSSFESVAKFGAFFKDHGSLGASLIGYYGSIDDAKEALNERYIGRFDSVAEFAECHLEECFTIPEGLRPYIDYQAFARDLEINDLVVISGEDGCHLFWNR